MGTGSFDQMEVKYWEVIASGTQAKSTGGPSNLAKLTKTSRWNLWFLLGTGCMPLLVIRPLKK